MPTSEDKGEWTTTTQARERGDWARVHISHHEQYDGMAPGHGRLIVQSLSNGLARCQACGALIEVPDA